ncbi:MAG: sugar phosphate isomerase/epimerase family protein [Promethearchaeota archaeon]
MEFSTTLTNPIFSRFDTESILEFLVSSGFDAVDIPGEPFLFPVQEIAELFDSFSPRLKIGELTACINPSRDLIHPDPVRRKGAINYIKYCIDSASMLGCDLTHFCFITGTDNLESTPLNLLESRAIEAIRDISNHSGDLGITLLIEPLFKADVTIVNRAGQAVDLFSRALDVDVEEFKRGNMGYGLLLDLFHMHLEEENLIDTIEEYISITHHVHVADHSRGLNFTREDTRFVKDALRTLKAQNYSKLVSFESFDGNVTLDDFEAALKNLHSFT